MQPYNQPQGRISSNPENQEAAQSVRESIQPHNQPTGGTPTEEQEQERTSKDAETQMTSIQDILRVLLEDLYSLHLSQNQRDNANN